LVQLGPGAGFDPRDQLAVRRKHEDMSERGVGHEQPARLSMVKPSGPLAPNIEQKRPTLETLPSFMNGNARPRCRASSRRTARFRGIEHQAVRADAGIDQAVEPAVGDSR
jgi:hypothetical protein